MAVNTHIPIPVDGIAAFCQRHGIVRLALFGSVLRDDFRPDSDIDVLVEFGADSIPDFFRYIDMQDELGHIFGRESDL